MVQHQLDECPGCRVRPGSNHKEDCDHARCPDCGEQLIFHEYQHWPEDADGPDRAALWHGIAPIDEVAHTLNWWTDGAQYGLDRPVEDFDRVRFAIALKQVAWDPQAQRYVIGEINEGQINAAIQICS